MHAPQSGSPVTGADVVITGVRAIDMRFPTSASLDGSDAMNRSPDYSVAYVVLETNSGRGTSGHGLTFTNGRGTELCVAAIEALSHLVIGLNLADVVADMGSFWRHITGDSQLRWLGPEKGIIHMATGAVVNAVWDLWAKVVGKPLWRLVYDMTPEEVARCVDFRYIEDVLTPDEAVTMVRAARTGREDRLARLTSEGYPAYVTSVGWLGYSDDKVRRLCRERVAENWTRFKIKVGGDPVSDARRCALVREEIGWDRELMLDANQVWGVQEAIDWVTTLAPYRPLWIEEPTSPDDILGHATIAKALRPWGIAVATGEHCHNRVMFKQLMQAGGMGYCQLDACRLGGVNEVLAVMLMAAKFGIPVCPHAGGIGLSEYTQHLAAIDFLCISGEMDGRMVEYAGHLDEHFMHPATVRDGRYVLPTDPGYSIEMKRSTIDWFAAHPALSWPAQVS